MMYSGQVHCVRAGTAHSRRFDRLEEANRTFETLEEGIPCRYRDGRGGVDLERVRRDRLRARQGVIRAMLSRVINVLRCQF